LNRSSKSGDNLMRRADGAPYPERVRAYGAHAVVMAKERVCCTGEAEVLRNVAYGAAAERARVRANDPVWRGGDGVTGSNEKTGRRAAERESAL